MRKPKLRELKEAMLSHLQQNFLTNLTHLRRDLGGDLNLMMMNVLGVVLAKMCVLQKQLK